MQTDGEKSVKITATCDDRELLRRIRLFDQKRYSGPFVIVIRPDGARITEYGLPSVNDTLKWHERISNLAR